MPKTLIDINEASLAAAAEALHTTTKKDTVNEALRTAASLAARRRDLSRLISNELSDLTDQEIMRQAWQQ